MKAAFTYASSLDAKEETQANPLKIEDFEPKAVAAAPTKEKAAEAATSADGDGGAPAKEEVPAKPQSDAASPCSDIKGSNSTVQNENGNAQEDRACCDSCIVV